MICGKVRKSEIGIQSIFFVLMALIFVWVLWFGISKVFFVNDQISENERIAIKSDISKALVFCEDPLNAGNMRTFEIRNSRFNGLILIGSSELNADLKEVRDAGRNVALVKVSGIGWDDVNKKPTFASIGIVDSFDMPFDIKNSMIFYDDNGDGEFVVKIECN